MYTITKKAVFLGWSKHGNKLDTLGENKVFTLRIPIGTEIQVMIDIPDEYYKHIKNAEKNNILPIFELQ